MAKKSRTVEERSIDRASQILLLRADESNSYTRRTAANPLARQLCWPDVSNKRSAPWGA